MKVKLTITKDGKIELITQEGDFDAGKDTLEALLAALQAKDIDIQQTGQIETHNHEVLMTRTGESANIQVNQSVYENGTPHTH